jgi:cysteine desulfurase
MTQPIIYLDHAAATPMNPQVLAAMQPYFTEQFYNPSALYLAAKDVAKDLAEARSLIAHHLGARPSEVVFTAGGTEANNLAIHGVMQHFPSSNVVVSAIEHESVLAPADQYDHRLAPVLADGQVDVAQLEKLIDSQTVLVSIMYANNEIGTIQPLKQVATLVQAIRKSRQANKNSLPLYLHVDACQAAAYLDIHASRLGADLLTINGGKIYGPKQSGALYIRTGVELTPQMLGGGQERGYRSGTENVPGSIGLATALDLVQKDRKAETERLKTLQKLFFKLVEEKLPTAIINGSRTHRLPNNIHLTIPGQDNERLIMALDEAGIQAAAGSACSASTDQPSHVLKAIGLSEAKAQASLRFTTGHATDEAAVRRTVDTLAGLIA